MILPIMEAVEYLVAGSVLDSAAQSAVFGRAEDFGAPALARAQRCFASQVEKADHIFEIGLRALIEGLRTRLRLLADGAVPPARTAAG